MYDSYVGVVRSQLNMISPEFWNFKSNQSYRAILEHVSVDQGLQYMNLSEQKVDLDDFVDTFAQNDKYGEPVRASLNRKGFESTSPSNARYLYHSLLIKEHYEKFPTKNIVEIGGGFGGLCYFLKSMVDCNYHIFDLPDVMQLQERYLAAHNISCKFLDFNSELPDDFFLISNYCYSEIPDKSIRDKYKKVIDKSSGGFMLWNAPAMRNDVSLEETFGSRIIESRPENPLTGRGNLEIYW